MALFSVTSIGATGLGPVAAGWVEMNPSLGWRWIQWISIMIGGVLTFAVVITMKETRGKYIVSEVAPDL